MEPKISSISRKVWNIVKVAIYMIKKGINKRKILLDLNMMMKRGKIAGKALGNLMFHHHHDHHNHDNNNNNENDGPQEYEFSCSNTPMYERYFTRKRKTHKPNYYPNDQYYVPSPLPLEESENVDLNEVNSMLEMILSNEGASSRSVLAASPLLPGLGYGRSPAVRQLRITDSPFPVHSGEDDKKVDQAAEDFINKFYSQLKQQKY